LTLTTPWYKMPLWWGAATSATGCKRSASALPAYLLTKGEAMKKPKRTMYDIVREMGDKLENVAIDADAMSDEMSFSDLGRPRAYAAACDRVYDILDEADFTSVREAGTRLLKLAEKRKVPLKKMEAW
jgi:hypothetical protein